MYVNKDNNQFIADKISRRQGMRCKKGGGYGISESSINYSVKNNLGKYPMHPEKYFYCNCHGCHRSKLPIPPSSPLPLRPRPSRPVPRCCRCFLQSDFLTGQGK